MPMDMARYIKRDRLVDTFLKLVAINSPSFEERDIGKALTVWLEKAGCIVEFWDYGGSGNIVARKKGNHPGAHTLMLSGHMDTIEPTTGIVVSNENGVIRTAGDTVLGADDKSALAQILEALAVLEEHNIPHGDIEVVFTSAEEKGLAGARSLDFSRLKSRHALVLDSSGSVGKLVVAAPTHYTYAMKITGRAAHAGIEPEKGLNAVTVAARIISGIPDGRIDVHTTANVGIIGGGTATNVVPKEVLVRGEVRSHSAEVLGRIREEIGTIARSVAGAQGAGLEIAWEEEYRSFRIGSDDPFLRFLLSVYRQCGLEPACVITGGGSDANIYNEKGIRAINISTGMQKVHSSEEYILINDLCMGGLVVLKTICDFGGFGQTE
jgi:tripeptide aminopeptidase